MLFLSGCSNDDVGEQQSTLTTLKIGTSAIEGQAGPNKSHLTRELGENATIDAEISISKRASIPVAEVALKAFDASRITAALFGGDTTVQEQVSDGAWVVRSRSGDSSCNYFNSPTSSGLYFQTRWVEYVFNVVHWRQDDYENNVGRFATQAELTFASRTDTLTAAEEVTKLLGVENTGNAKIYALDYETLALIEKEMEASGNFSEYAFKNAWGAEDDCYLVTMDYVIDGIPVNYLDTVSLFEEETIAGSRIAALYSDRGLEYLEVMNCYSLEGTQDSLPVLSADEAIAAIATKFNSLITESQYIITEAALKYIPQFRDDTHTEIQLVPAWYFTVDETGVSDKNGETYHNTRQLIFDAYSGKEM